MLTRQPLAIAMLSIHSSPIGELGRKDTGGMSVYVRELARALGKRGHRVDIFTKLHDSSLTAPIQLYRNVRLIHIRAGNGGNLPAADLYPHLDDFCRELDAFTSRERVPYDLVHSHYWLSGQAGKWLQNHWRTPHVIMFHTLAAAKGIAGLDERGSELRLAVERDLAQNCHRILAATESEKGHLLRYYGAQPDRVGVVPCGVDLNRFVPMDKQAARKRVGFGADHPIVLYVGRVAPIKGVDRLLAAMTFLRGIENLKLVVIGGEGPCSPESRNLRRLCRDLDLQEVVLFKGRVKHEMLPPYYCAADVLVLPSHYETFGLVALEALACGTPVVATPVGAMTEILRNDQNGRVVSEATPRSLASNIEECLGRSRAGGFSAAAMRATIQGFGWDDVASSIIGEYRILLGALHGKAGFDACADISAPRATP